MESRFDLAIRTAITEELNVMSKKKDMRARKKLLATPWWKVKDNWFYVGLLVFLFVIVGLAAVV